MAAPVLTLGAGAGSTGAGVAAAGAGAAGVACSQSGTGSAGAACWRAWASLAALWAESVFSQSGSTSAGGVSAAGCGTLPSQSVRRLPRRVGGGRVWSMGAAGGTAWGGVTGNPDAGAAGCCWELVIPALTLGAAGAGVEAAAEGGCWAVAEGHAGAAAAGLGAEAADGAEAGGVAPPMGRMPPGLRAASAAGPVSGAGASVWDDSPGAGSCAFKMPRSQSGMSSAAGSIARALGRGTRVSSAAALARRVSGSSWLRRVVSEPVCSAPAPGTGVGGALLLSRRARSQSGISASGVGAADSGDGVPGGRVAASMAEPALPGVSACAAMDLSQSGRSASVLGMVGGSGSAGAVGGGSSCSLLSQSVILRRGRGGMVTSLAVGSKGEGSAASGAAGGWVTAGVAGGT